MQAKCKISSLTYELKMVSSGKTKILLTKDKIKYLDSFWLRRHGVTALITLQLTLLNYFIVYIDANSMERM